MKVFEFTKYRMAMIIFSVAVIASGIAVTLSKGGFNLGIDFDAGLIQQVQLESDITTEDVEKSLASIDGMIVQTLGDDDSGAFVLRVKADEDKGYEIRNTIDESLKNSFGTIDVISSEFVGPMFSQNLSGSTLRLVILAMSFILLYIWVRFKLAYAVAAIAAIVHDVAVLVLFIGAIGMEVSTATIAAILTIIGYSLNDTIVIFDRIRENEGLMEGEALPKIVNTSISQSLSRTIITSLTTLLAVLAIYIFATGSIQQFALALIVGILVGTYSSIFIASPVFMGLRGLKKK